MLKATLSTRCFWLEPELAKEPLDPLPPSSLLSLLLPRSKRCCCDDVLGPALAPSSALSSLAEAAPADWPLLVESGLERQLG